MMTVQNPELAQDGLAFLDGVIRDFLRDSPLNRLEHFGGEAVFTDVQVGLARGDDPIFQTFRQVVHPEHGLPTELLASRLAALGERDATVPGPVAVVAYALSMHPETVRSNAEQTVGPSLRWNHSRWQGEAFSNALLAHLVETLEAAGAPALAPSLAADYRIDREGRIASNWSHRHAAYAAGLGTFSLNDGFITPKGIAVWFGSLVTAAAMVPTPRPEGGHLANCLAASRGTCGACMARCPVQAISREGHDKARCMQEIFLGQKPWLEGAHGPGYIGKYAGCGLCMTGVPCSMRKPG